MTSSNTPRVVRCRQCGYNLQGISSDSRCPECGEPADHGIAAAALLSTGNVVPIHLSNRRWIRAVRRGAGALMLAAVLFNLLALLLCLERNALNRSGAASIAIAMGAFVSLAAGAGFFPMREPWTGAAAPNRLLRFLIRIGFVLCGLMLLSPTWLSSSHAIWLYRAYPFAVNGTSLIATVPALWLAASLAMRSGQPRLAMLSRLCVIAVIIAAIAEPLAGPATVDAHTARQGVTQPLIADANALGLLVEMLRYRPRMDATVVIVAFNAIVSLGISAVWAGLWIGLSAPAQEPPALDG